MYSFASAMAVACQFILGVPGNGGVVAPNPVASSGENICVENHTHEVIFITVQITASNTVNVVLQEGVTPCEKGIPVS